MSDKELAVTLLEKVGGESNVTSVMHCVTRLRFKLIDESVADDEYIKSLDRVQGLAKKGGQYQIIIGPAVVDRIYDETLKLGSFESGVLDINEDDNNGGLFSRFVDLVAGIFTPVLGLLASSGMIKGFLALFTTLGWMSTEGTTYTVLYAIGDSMYYFLPVLLAFFAMKKFGGTPMYGVLIATIFVYPTITAMASADNVSVLFEGSAFAANVKGYIFGIPLVLPAGGYAQSVMPIIFITYIASKFEKLAKKIVPDMVALFFIPMITILCASLIGIIVVGPVISIATSLVNVIFLTVLSVSKIVYGALIGGLWPILVMFGLHWAIAPLGFAQLGELQAGNIDKMTILAPTLVMSFAQIGGVLAIIIKSKDEKFKQIAIPAFITGVFGITEPAIYGVTLPRKKDFIFTCIAGAIGGALVMGTGIGTYMSGGLGIFRWLSYLNPNDPSATYDFRYAVIISVLTFVIAFVLVYFFGQKDDKAEDNALTKKHLASTAKQNAIISPVKGEKVATSEISDDTFAQEMIGKTYGINPSDSDIVSPISGKVSTVFPTKHAVGIIGENGIEVLIHIGIDTVGLEGKGFESFIQVDDDVVQGQKILSVDFEYIREQGLDPTVITIITNSNQFELSDDEISENELVKIK